MCISQEATDSVAYYLSPPIISFEHYIVLCGLFGGILVSYTQSKRGRIDLSGNGCLSFKSMSIEREKQQKPSVQNCYKKFMHVWIDVKCMHTNFGGHGLSGFGDIATLKNDQIFLSDHGL